MTPTPNKTPEIIYISNNSANILHEKGYMWDCNTSTNYRSIAHDIKLVTPYVIKSKYDELQAENEALQKEVERLKIERERVINIHNLEKERLKWSLETFTEATALSSMFKLIGEANEIIADIKSGKREPEEYADVLMCLFDSAGRQGISVDEIFEAFEKKLRVNKIRTWVKNPDNSYSHVNPTE